MGWGSDTPALLFMEPSKEFVKALHVISPNLSVKWERVIERWGIDYKNSQGQTFRILEVKNPDQTYRPLDERTLQVLRLSDMSAKVHDIQYYLTEQFRKRASYVAKAKEQNRERALQRSREISQRKWNDAIANAEKGIWSPKQLDRRVFSIPSATLGLVNKLGMPRLSAKAIEVNP